LTVHARQEKGDSVYELRKLRIRLRRKVPNRKNKLLASSRKPEAA
jgi:hypothetical protein